MFRKNLRSPLQNNTLCCFVRCVRIPVYILRQKQKHPLTRMLCFWRRGRDSNPRELSPKLISSQPRYDHFDTSACMIKLRESLIFVVYPAGSPVMPLCGSRNFKLACRFAKFRPRQLLIARLICQRQRSQTSPLRYLCVYD